VEFPGAERKIVLQLNLLIGSAGITFLAAFGSHALAAQRFTFATALLSMALAGLLILLVMARTSEPRIGAYGFSLISMIAAVYLVLTGGIEGTGPLWCFPLLVIWTFLLGLGLGSLATVCVLAIVLALFYLPDLPVDAAEYPAVFKLRFVSAFTALAIMSTIYEYVRNQSETKERALTARLEAASRTDELTGVANRRAVHDLLEKEYAGYARNGTMFSVIMLDLDYFKSINDNFGHAAGDYALATVAARLAATLRAQDSVARWGGEEFLLLLPQTELHEAARVAEKIRRVVSGITLNETAESPSLSASLGVACVGQARDLEVLLSQADKALYAAKDNGRNRVEIFTAEDDEPRP
jgi:diguanylate cyclase (GGDEF)-like protein